MIKHMYVKYNIILNMYLVDFLQIAKSRMARSPPPWRQRPHRQRGTPHSMFVMGGFIMGGQIME